MVVVEDDFGKPSTMDESDVLVTDWSGIAYEFAYKTRRPTLFVNTPMKVINPEWKRIDLVPTDISFRDEVGVSVDPSALKPAADGAAAPVAAVVADMLARPDAFAAKIDRLFSEQFFNPGHAGEKVGAYIIDALIARRAAKS